MSHALAQFFDGETAIKRQVVVILTAQGLSIRETDTGAQTHWPLSQLTLIDGNLEEGAVRLSIESNAEARLIVEDADFCRSLAVTKPDLRKVRRFARAFGIMAALTVVSAALIAWAWYDGIPRMSQTVAEWAPAPWAESLGRNIKKVIAPKTCSSADGDAALKVLVTRLSRGMDFPYPLDVSVADSKTVNAFALPGGHIVIMRGLIEAVESPDEVAGVLAHEMGHVAMRHPMAGIVRSVGISLMLDMMIGGGDMAEAVAGFGGNLLNLSYTRDAEREADAFALDVLHGAGIGTGGVEVFFERLKKKARDTGLDEKDDALAYFMRTHPALQERIDTAAAQIPQKAIKPALSAEDWHALRTICPAQPVKAP